MTRPSPRPPRTPQRKQVQTEERWAYFVGGERRFCHPRFRTFSLEDAQVFWGPTTHRVRITEILK